MRSQQLAILVMVRRAASAWLVAGLADMERSVVPHRTHDHRQLARHGDTSLAVAGAFGDRLAPVLDLVGALEARHQTRRRLVDRASHISVAGLRYAALNTIEGPTVSAVRSA